MLANKRACNATLSQHRFCVGLSSLDMPVQSDAVEKLLESDALRDGVYVQGETTLLLDELQSMFVRGQSVATHGTHFVLSVREIVLWSKGLDDSCPIDMIGHYHRNLDLVGLETFRSEGVELSRLNKVEMAEVV